MAGRYCCTALPRSFTPDQPPSRAVELNVVDVAEDAEAGEPSSRYTSARTEELQEIRQIFNEANFLAHSVGVVRRKSRDLQHAYVVKHPSVGDLFPKIRNKLSRKSKSKSMTMVELLHQTQLQRAKGELSKTLTSGGGPDAGGYDEDALELKDVDASMTLLNGEVSSTRGRGKHRSSDTQIGPSSTGKEFHNRHSRLSSSLSPPRRSTESHPLRRSWSDSSLASAVNSKLPQIRLPSFEAATNSKSWRKSVMHSLQISPSLPNFSETDGPCQSNPQVKEETFTPDTLERVPAVSLPSFEEGSYTGFFKSSLDHPWAFSHSAKPSVASARATHGLLREPGNGRRSSNTSVHLYNMRISHHLRSPSSISNTPFISAAPTAAPSAAPTRAQTPDPDTTMPSSPPQISIKRKPTPIERVQTPVQRKLSPLQHVQTSVKRNPTQVQRKPTPIQRAMSEISRNGSIPLPARPARHQRHISGSGFSTEDVPEEWGNVVRGDDAASSMYSTALESPGCTPRASVSHLACPSVATIHEHPPESTTNLVISDEIATLTATARQSPNSDLSPAAQTAGGTMPENPSTSNLSDNSKSSKVSRFKEDFNTSMTKKSTKRNSIVNLFTRSKVKRRSANTESFDGSSDDFLAEQPRRLQRANRLSEKQDAAGLLAKAIKAHHEEKSALFLDSSKASPRDMMFRQRSSSFCRPRNQSTASEDAGEGSSGAKLSALPLPHHRRSTSDTFLTPEFSMPSFDQGSTGRIPQKRSASAGLLRPGFSTSIFASDLSPGQQSPSSVRPRLSVALDPMESLPMGAAEAGSRSRSPSFQLNDLPEMVESQPPTPGSLDASRPTSGNFSECVIGDLDDPNLNLGPWSRYPSHTREKRTGSASTADKVKTRDFAYDINPLNILEEEDSSDDSPRSKWKRKGRKKRRTGLPKSKSMMLGKEYIKNYVRLIRSPSIEWLTHGKGHRSSISAGGSVEHPELEILPPVFASRPIIEDEEGEANASPIKVRKGEIELQEIRNSLRDHGPSTSAASSGQSPYDGSADINITAAERKRRAASSPDLPTREMAGSRASDALTWSRHYESCVYLPRASQSSEQLCQQLDGSEDAHESTVSSEIPLLIDSMLARSRASSMNHHPMASTNTFPLRKKSKSHHVPHTSVGSMCSIRASSMDLLKTLAEAEEMERMKCLEMLTRARSGASSRQGSNSVEVVEVVQKVEERETAVVTTYDMQNVMPVVHAV
jgi:hypothetical protein